MITAAEASERILTATTALGTQIVAIDAALGRILGRDVVSGRNLPPWDNSAMDGFAVQAKDVPGTLPVAGTVAAGHAPDAVLAAGTTWRIMTGAPVPQGADAVVIREDVDDRGGSISFSDVAKPGQNIRRAGNDVAKGDRVLQAGTRLGPGEIGLLAALSHAVVDVGSAPRVTILSTGDELVGVDVVPRAGQIVNSNAYALAAQVREAGGIPVHVGIAPDEPATLVDMLGAGLRADVLLTSGGVSVGDYDHVKDAFAAAGVEVEFWKVAIKPGKPLVFGVASTGALVFGLPGNPVSTMVVFELFVRPALLAMQGAAALHRPRADVVLTVPYKKRPGRAHYVRARLQRRGDTLYATPLSKQSSGALSSMVGVDALVEIDKDAESIDVGHNAGDAGARVSAILLRAV